MSIALFFIFMLLQVPVDDYSPRIFPCEAYLEKARTLRAENRLLDEIELLEEAVTQSCSTSSKAYSQLSLCYLESGDQSYSERGSSDNTLRKEYFGRALKAAKVSAQLDSTNKYAFEHMAMAFAGILDVNGIKHKVQLADSVRLNAEIALELDPENDRALHILGRWHYEVSQFGGFLRFLARLFFGTAPTASFEKARDYFQRAVEIDDFPVHNYWLGLTYLKLDDEPSAVWHFEHLLELEQKQHNDEFFKTQARELLEDIQ